MARSRDAARRLSAALTHKRRREAITSCLAVCAGSAFIAAMAIPVTNIAAIAAAVSVVLFLLSAASVGARNEAREDYERLRLEIDR